MARVDKSIDTAEMSIQLKITEQQRAELVLRIEEDYRHAIEAHTARMERWAGYYRRWRRLATPGGEADRSNFRTPLLQSQILLKLAKELDALFGDDAEIIAKPTAAADHRIVKKVGRYMTWRMIDEMKMVPRLCEFDFNRITFGRAHAYVPFEVDHYQVYENGAKREAVHRRGPMFYPIKPGDLIVPPIQAVDSVHDFPWVIRRYRQTVSDLIKGERHGAYAGVAAIETELRETADTTAEVNEDNEVAREAEEAEGVLFDTSGQGGRDRGTLELYEWYSTVEWGGEEIEVAVVFEPQTQSVLSVQDLVVRYPTKRRRRPICEGALIRDGSYFGMGFGEMLSDLEDEDSVVQRLLTDAGQFSVGPVIFAKPTAGFDPETHRIEPFQINWTEDPGAVNQVKFDFDPQYPVLKSQMVRAEVERLTGQTDQTAGRTIDRPNAPRTATGQIALIEEGNTRASLDVRMLREDTGAIAEHIWELEVDLNDEKTFFRVTEEDAGGAFRTSGGGGSMEPDEFAGRYDFRVKFATSRWSRDAHRERIMAFYQLAMGNPLLANDPRALWWITNETAKALNIENLSDFVAQPPDMGLPKIPRDEWTLALQGEDLLVHAGDDDQVHLLDHFRRIEEEKNGRDPDVGAIKAMLDHIVEHQQQHRRKQMMQALMKDFVQQSALNDSESGGITLGGGQPLAIQQLQANLGEMFGTGGGAPQPGQGSGPPTR